MKDSPAIFLDIKAVIKTQMKGLYGRYRTKRKLALIVPSFLLIRVAGIQD